MNTLVSLRLFGDISAGFRVLAELPRNLRHKLSDPERVALVQRVGTQLRVVRCFPCKFDELQVLLSKSATSLRVLELEAEEYSETKALSLVFAKCTQLRELSLELDFCADSHRTDVSLQSLKTLEKLVLKLSCCRGDNCPLVAQLVRACADVPEVVLKDLETHDYDISQVAQLGELKSLTSLTIGGMLEGETVPTSLSFPKLQRLSLGCTKLSLGLAMPELHELTDTGNCMTAIFSMRNLQTIRFFATDFRRYPGPAWTLRMLIAKSKLLPKLNRVLLPPDFEEIDSEGSIALEKFKLARPHVKVELSLSSKYRFAEPILDEEIGTTCFGCKKSGVGYWRSVTPDTLFTCKDPQAYYCKRMMHVRCAVAAGLARTFVDVKRKMAVCTRCSFCSVADCQVKDKRINGDVEHYRCLTCKLVYHVPCMRGAVQCPAGHNLFGAPAD